MANMQKDSTLIYPVIMHEVTDETGHYYGVDSPNIPGMITDGKTRAEAAENAIDAIATMLDGETYPDAQDPEGWTLESGDSVVYISVDMGQWYREKALYLASQKKVRMSIMVPEGLRDAAKSQGVNVSKVATDALAEMLG